MPDVESKIKTSFMMKIIDLIQNKNLNLLYAAYAKCNLHRNLKNLNPNLYLRNSLVRPTPNPTWKQTIELTQSIKTSTQSWENLKFRDLYWKFLNPTPNLLPKINAVTQPTSRLTIFLRKPSPRRFSPMEKEIAFRVAHNAYLWGSFNTILNQNNSKKSSHFCNQPPEFPSHVIHDCTIASQVLNLIQKEIPIITQQNVILSKPLILYNTNSETDKHIQITQIFSIYKQVMIQKRKDQTTKNCTPPKKDLTLSIFETIKGKIQVKMKSGET